MTSLYNTIYVNCPEDNKLFGSVYSGSYKVNGNICTSSKQNNIDYTNLYTL